MKKFERPELLVDNVLFHLVYAVTMTYVTILYVFCRAVLFHYCEHRMFFNLKDLLPRWASYKNSLIRNSEAYKQIANRLVLH